MTPRESSRDATLDWTELDDAAVDTVRVLAMDAVQKVGNGHPGTAMSLAPAAYLLFQKVMRHDPADPDWAGRDRFVLSCGHSSLTLYIQLYLAGYGLELDDLKSLRTWGSKTPGHPEHGHTAGVETTTGPLGQGVGNAVGMAMAARRERGLFDPDAAPGESPFDHHIYVIASDGDIEEGISGEASSLAGTQQLGNLDADLRRQPDLDRGRHRHRVRPRTSPRATRPTAGTCSTSTGPTAAATYDEDVQALYDAIEAAEAVTDQPSFIVLHTIIGWPAPNKQNTGKAHGSALGADEVAATKKVLGFDPEQTFEVADDVLEHTRRPSTAAGARSADWDERVRRLGGGQPGSARRCSTGCATRTLPDGWDDALPTFDADAKGVATRKASGDVLNAVAGACPSCGAARPTSPESNNTTIEGEPSFLPGRPRHEDVQRRPVRPRAALRHPRARAWARS